MKKIKLLSLILLFMGAISSYAQTRLITGTVVSDEDNKPIPGVSIQVKETTIGTVSDMNGDFSLRVPTEAQTLIFSFVGMETREVDIEGKNFISVTMGSEVMGLEEVMVVAYGTAKKESFTGSAEVINNNALEKRPVANVSKALEGQVPGLQSTSGSGQPGNGASVIIRGFGSINSGISPLYVVDGIPYDGYLNSINPGDIESITVLKDAAAGALYGSRGANGVILITTKKGEDQELTVQIKASYGLSDRAIKRYKTLDAAGFIEASFQGYKNDLIYSGGVHPDLAGQMAVQAMKGSTGGIFGADQMYNPYDMPVDQLIDPETGKVNPSANLLYETNWLDEITNDNATRQEYQLFLSGGSETSEIFTSLAYLNEEGLLKTTDFERISGRVSAELTPKTWLTYGGSLNFSKTETSYLGGEGDASNSNVWYSAQFMAPIYPVYLRDEMGNPVLSETGEKQFDYGKTRPAGATPNWNPVATLYEDDYKSAVDNLSGRFHINLLGDVLNFSGLSLNTNLGFDYANTNQTTYFNPDFGNAEAVNGRLNLVNDRTFSYTLNELLRYERDFGNHSINILAGHEFYKLKIDDFAGEKTGFPYSGIKVLAPGATISSL